MSTASNLFSTSNHNLANRVQDEMAKRRLSSLIVAVREHEARIGRQGLGVRRYDDALYRNARDVYERY
jgi:hypothetical protein